MKLLKDPELDWATTNCHAYHCLTFCNPNKGGSQNWGWWCSLSPLPLMMTKILEFFGLNLILAQSISFSSRSRTFSASSTDWLSNVKSSMKDLIGAALDQVIILHPYHNSSLHWWWSPLSSKTGLEILDTP